MKVKNLSRPAILLHERIPGKTIRISCAAYMAAVNKKIYRTPAYVDQHSLNFETDLHAIYPCGSR